MRDDDGTAHTLAMCEPLGHARDVHTIVFRGAPEAVPPQRIYRLEHAAIGASAIFLVPIGRDARGVTYEAVFT